MWLTFQRRRFLDPCQLSITDNWKLAKIIRAPKIVLHVIQVAMLSVRLDPEIEQQLADLLAHEPDSNRSELIKRLIKERWLTLYYLDRPFVERRGGHPKHLLQDKPPDLSERAAR